MCLGFKHRGGGCYSDLAYFSHFPRPHTLLCSKQSIKAVMDLGMTRILALVTSTLAHRRRRAFSACLGRQLLATRGKIKLYKKYGLAVDRKKKFLNRFWHFLGSQGGGGVGGGGVSWWCQSILKVAFKS